MQIPPLTPNTTVRPLTAIKMVVVAGDFGPQAGMLLAHASRLLPQLFPQHVDVLLEFAALHVVKFVLRDDERWEGGST